MMIPQAPDKFVKEPFRVITRFHKIVGFDGILDVGGEVASAAGKVAASHFPAPKQANLGTALDLCFAS